MRNLIIAVFLCICVSACGPGDRELGCIDNLECGPGEACIDGECVLPECLKNSDCPQGQICQEYRCQLDVECTQDGDCALGSICQDNHCVVGCRNERDCPDGWECSGNQCVQPGCKSDADCPQNTRCNIQTGACQPVTKLIEGDSCAVDDECDQSAGLLCDSQVECYGCMMADPEFNPTFTCRYQCDLQVLTCPVEDRLCKYRHVGLIGLCIPSED
jgi:Cys-rich repeat protein